MKVIFTFCFDTETKELTTGGNCDTITAAKLLNNVLLDALKATAVEKSEKKSKKSGDEQEKLDKAKKV